MKVIKINEFSSELQRMSVIVKYNKKLFAFIKGCKYSIIIIIKIIFQLIWT